MSIQYTENDKNLKKLKVAVPENWILTQSRFANYVVCIHDNIIINLLYYDFVCARAVNASLVFF